MKVQKRGSFDKVFYSKISIWAKVFIFSMFLLIVGNVINNIVMCHANRSGSVLFLIFVIFIFIAFFNGFIYKIIGVNQEGIYSSGRGWYYWQEIQSIKVKEVGWGKKQKCIQIDLKKDVPFLRKVRYWFFGKRIPAIFSTDITIPIEDMFQIVQEYHRKYGKKV